MTTTIHSFPGNTLVIEDKTYRYFGGTSYLGIQQDQKFQTCLSKNIAIFGTNYGASRLANVQLAIFDEVETYLCNYVGSEACVTMSSGYLAGQLVSQYFQQLHYPTFYMPNTHVALSTPCSKLHRSFQAMQEAVNTHLANANAKTPVIFLDTIDFMGDQFPQYKQLQSLPLDRVILVADDSHGIGVVGENGCGAIKHLKALHPKELIISCSLGKGFGIQAGAIFGSQIHINALKTTAFFGGASPAAPAGLKTLMESETIYAKNRQLLFENLSYFQSHCTVQKKFRYNQEFPSYMYFDDKLTKSLKQNHIIVTSFHYPHAHSPKVHKIIISAYHTKSDLDKLIQHLNNYFA